MSDFELRSINIGSVDKETFDTFIANYKKNQTKLCVNKGVKSIELLRDLTDDYEGAKMINSHDKVLFICKANESDYEILAFALLREHVENKTIILQQLCSNVNKTLRMEGKKLGAYLLDYIYDEYVINQSYILKLEPATKELVPYYVSWKKPTLPMSTFNNHMTYGYLVYGDMSNIKEHASTIFADFNLIDSVKRYLHINTQEFDTIANKQKHKFLYRKLKENRSLSESEKSQIENMIDNIQIFSIEELESFSGGRKRRSKCTMIKRRKMKSKTIRIR